MKNFLMILSVAGVVALACWALPEGMRRQRLVDCEKASEICTKYWDAHRGNCRECRTMTQCQKDGIK